MKIPGYTLIGPLTYQGKKNCESATCTRRYDPKTKTLDSDCHGWHCVYCDAACSYQGHRCDAADAVLGEAGRVYEERADQPSAEDGGQPSREKESSA